jgi:uncharacterized membrane protein YwaF
MGVEAFIYPFLVLICVLASGIFAWLLNRALGTKYRFLQLLSVALAAPLAVLLLALRDPSAVWEYVRISTGLAIIASCSVAVLYALIRLRK